MITEHTIRQGLVDSINQMSRLLATCEDPNQCFALRLRIRELFRQLDRVIVTDLDPKKASYQQAIDELASLVLVAQQARTESNQVVETIKQANATIKKIEKLIAGVSGLLTVI